MMFNPDVICQTMLPEVRRGKEGGADWILPGEGDASTRLDAVFEALADGRRRYPLYCLTKEPVHVPDRSMLSEYIRTKEEEAPDDTDGSPTRSAIEVDSHHNHSPKLADAGSIDYDTRQGSVRYDEPADLQEWREHARHKEGSV